MNKDLNLLCMSCFSPLPSAGAPCPMCGYVEGAQAQAPHQLPIRTILAGKYLIGRVLGEGGFGITYVGYDLNLDIRVAVKEYFPSGFATRTSTVSETVSAHTGDTDGIFVAGRERFVGEAKRLAHFRTLPGIVMVNDFFAENGTAYIVMEYVEGRTLKEYLAQQGGTLPTEHVVNMLAPVFASLAQVHGSGIIHRDISPDNIMITSDGTVKLLDFGAAREFSESGNKSLSVLLKHGYAPMEQYTTRGKQGPWTDVYALAATIYKAITGKTPEGSMDRVMEDLLALPSRLGVPISPQQEAALTRALAVRAEDRFQTMGEFYAALCGQSYENAQYDIPAPISQQGAQTAPITPNSEKTPNSKKKPAIIAAAIAGVVLIATLIAVNLSGGGDRQSGSSIFDRQPTYTYEDFLETLDPAWEATDVMDDDVLADNNLEGFGFAPDSREMERYTRAGFPAERIFSSTWTGDLEPAIPWTLLIMHYEDVLEASVRIPIKGFSTEEMLQGLRDMELYYNGDDIGVPYTENTDSVYFVRAGDPVYSSVESLGDDRLYSALQNGEDFFMTTVFRDYGSIGIYLTLEKIDGEQYLYLTVAYYGIVWDETTGFTYDSSADASAPQRGTELETDAQNKSLLALAPAYRTIPVGNNKDRIGTNGVGVSDSISVGGQILNNVLVFRYGNGGTMTQYTIHDLNGQYVELTGYVGHADDGAMTDAIMTVYGDDTILFEKEIYAADEPIYFTIEVQGVTDLKIEMAWPNQWGEVAVVVIAELT